MDIPRVTSHQSDVTLDDILNIVDRFPGMKDLILAISSDNASNMTKIYRLINETDRLGKSYLGGVPCMSHNTNLMNECIVKDSNEKENVDNHIDGSREFEDILNNAIKIFPSDNDFFDSCDNVLAPDITEKAKNWI